MSSLDMRNGGLGKWKDLNGNDKLRKNLKMKVTFEFDTSAEDFYDNFDHIKLYQMQIADDMARTLNKITEQVRSWVKYEEREAIPTGEIFDKVWEIIQDNNISMEKLGY